MKSDRLSQPSRASASIPIAEIAEAPKLMRRLIDSDDLARFIAATPDKDPERMVEAYFASLSPRPTFGLADDLRVRERFLATDVPALRGAPVIAVDEPLQKLRSGALDEALSASVLLYCRIRHASDFGLDFVRSVRAAEERLIGGDHEASVEDRVLAHSALLLADAIARAAGAELPADKAERLRIEFVCFDYNALVEPIRREDALSPARFGALALGIVQ